MKRNELHEDIENFKVKQKTMRSIEMMQKKKDEMAIKTKEKNRTSHYRPNPMLCGQEKGRDACRT